MCEYKLMCVCLVSFLQTEISSNLQKKCMLRKNKNFVFFWKYLTYLLKYKVNNIFCGIARRRRAPSF